MTCGEGSLGGEDREADPSHPLELGQLVFELDRLEEGRIGEKRVNKFDNKEEI